MRVIPSKRGKSFALKGNHMERMRTRLTKKRKLVPVKKTATFR